MISLRSSERYYVDNAHTERCIPILDAFISLFQDSSTPHDITQEIRDTMLTVYTVGLRGMKFFEKSKVGDLWTSLALHTGVSEQYAAHNISWELETSIPFPSHNAYFKACGWKSCLCSHKRPSHSMRVCRGCWVTHYCSQACQMR